MKPATHISVQYSFIHITSDSWKKEVENNLIDFFFTNMNPKWPLQIEEISEDENNVVVTLLITAYIR